MTSSLFNEHEWDIECSLVKDLVSNVRKVADAAKRCVVIVHADTAGGPSEKRGKVVSYPGTAAFPRRALSFPFEDILDARILGVIWDDARQSRGPSTFSASLSLVKEMFREASSIVIFDSPALPGIQDVIFSRVSNVSLRAVVIVLTDRRTQTEWESLAKQFIRPQCGLLNTAIIASITEEEEGHHTIYYLH